MLEKAQRQLANRIEDDFSHSSAARIVPSETLQPPQPSAARPGADDGLALDDAENPLQLLARASDLQLTPRTITQNASSTSPNALSSPGTTVYSGHSTCAIDSFFVPIRASLDVGPELDPVDLGLVTFEDANNLFALYEFIYFDL